MLPRASYACATSMHMSMWLWHCHACRFALQHDCHGKRLRSTEATAPIVASNCSTAFGKAGRITAYCRVIGALIHAIHHSMHRLLCLRQPPCTSWEAASADLASLGMLGCLRLDRHALIVRPAGVQKPFPDRSAFRSWKHSSLSPWQHECSPPSPRDSGSNSLSHTWGFWGCISSFSQAGCCCKFEFPASSYI